jgi:hypothetical protein
MKSLVVTAAIGLLLTSCAHYMRAQPAQVTVTEQDHIATVHVGQKLEVALHARNGMNNWTHPTSSDTTMLAPAVDPAATAAVGVTLAMFVGVKAGTVGVTSDASPKCPPDAACPMYLAVYSLKVTVTP